MIKTTWISLKRKKNKDDLWNSFIVPITLNGMILTFLPKVFVIMINMMLNLVLLAKLESAISGRSIIELLILICIICYVPL